MSVNTPLPSPIATIYKPQPMRVISLEITSMELDGAFVPMAGCVVPLNTLSYFMMNGGYFKTTGRILSVRMGPKVPKSVVGDSALIAQVYTINSV